MNRSNISLTPKAHWKPRHIKKNDAKAHRFKKLFDKIEQVSEEVRELSKGKPEYIIVTDQEIINEYANFGHNMSITVTLVTM